SLNRLLFLDMRCGLADNLLMFGDKMSMAASVEARVPFLDLELVRTVEAIPGRLKLEGGRPKALMKDVVRSWLPESVLDKKKLGFEIPEAKWFQTSLSPFVRESLLSSDGHLASILDRQAVSKLLDDHAAGRQNLWRQIFALLSIEMVYRQFLRGTKP
ncbi:MAG TPA: asparagine synthetase B, partial [Candidatus Latescibacteria bacterium]|nr:asparagine synthetase B [Candidatus Latescibacterota bacterium]